MSTEVANYLKRIRQLIDVGGIPASDLQLVVSNEACDLDSVICGLVMAMWLDCCGKQNRVVIPVCSIDRVDLPLRTEVTHWLERDCQLACTDLFFLDDLPKILNQTSGKPVRTVLVDQNVLPPALHDHSLEICGIIDHHQLLGETDRAKLDIFRHDLCGSCASLVTELIADDLLQGKMPKIAGKLLLGPILIDTDRCLGVKTTDQDRKALKIIQQVTGNSLDVYALFCGLEAAKYQIDGLSLYDLLRRDMKIALSQQRRIVCSTVFGLSTDQMLEQPFEAEAGRVCRLNHAPLLTALSKTQGHDYRGLLVWSCDPLRLPVQQQLVQFLQKQASLNLSHHQQHPNRAWSARINNPAISRKQFLPLLFQFLSMYALQPDNWLSFASTPDTTSQ